MSSLVSSIPDSLKSTGALLYGSAVACAFVIGAANSFGPYFKWLHQRKYRRIRVKSVETVVNISVDVGKFVFDVSSAGISSALVAATAPVSVPILLMLREEDPKPSEDSEKRSE
ncbi:hypothetical protein YASMINEVIRUS_627 [Yasminevirus sp. GU-2018]|uniref:Uncharacterized protein n=1 Tax=Yasminevirus sp. GU-2018 TaxID=2420051 RepID=A0A5K0U9J8_9VIRU|nr:hypothetical protein YASMINEVIRUS_627 [Yasminevirus sp. GU-2018]